MARKSGKKTSPEEMQKWTDKKLLDNMKRMVRADFGGSDNAPKVVIERVVRVLLGLDTTGENAGDIEKLIKIMDFLGKEGLLVFLGRAIQQTIQDTTASSRKRQDPYFDEVERRLGPDDGSDDLIERLKASMSK